MARPIPRPPPVTTAILPSRLPIIGSLSSSKTGVKIGDGSPFPSPLSPPCGGRCRFATEGGYVAQPPNVGYHLSCLGRPPPSAFGSSPRKGGSGERGGVERELLFVYYHRSTAIEWRCLMVWTGDGAVGLIRTQRRTARPVRRRVLPGDPGCRAVPRPRPPSSRVAYHGSLRGM